MVFIVGVWVLTARYGRGERYRVEARYTWFPGGSGHFSAPSTSASGVLPGVIARKAVFVVSVFRQRGAIAVDPHVLKADRTVSRMRLGLTHALWRRKLGGTIRHVWLTLTGVGAAAEQEDYRVTVLAESDELFVRQTPEGALYVSTREGRDGMVHEELIPAGPGEAAAVAKELNRHWRDWMKRADAMIQAGARPTAPAGPRER